MELSRLSQRIFAVPLGDLTFQLLKYKLHVPAAGQLILAVTGVFFDLVVP